jgi:5-formyltetrahydrofolate cyclo-ligase
MLKKDLRKDFLENRQKLGSEQLETLNHNISEKFITWLPDSVFTVHIYLPIREKNEINTWGIIHQLWEKGLNTIVPVMEMSPTNLTSWVLTPETKLQENIWGVPEPLSADCVDKSVIDVVVLPLISFDQKGYRVGYGKGFYDHFLASFHDQPVKVGLSLFDPVLKISDIHEADIAMDYCITPDKIWKFKSL